MKTVKAIQTTLTAPFGATDTSFTVLSFLDSKGNQLALADFGTELVLVLKQGTVSEMVKCNAVTANSNGTTTFTVSTNGRDLNATYPYAGSSTGQDFTAGADAMVTNDPYFMNQFIPLGSMLVWPLATAPTGWLKCDGSAVSRTTYASLFSLIGTTFGVGNGTTTFNLPNVTVSALITIIKY